MKAGRLDRRITLQKLTLGAKNALGEQLEVWTDISTVWANVSNPKADEINTAAEVKGRMTKVFRIRYSQDILDVNTKGRVVYDGVTYEITTAPIEIGRREGLEFTGVSRSE